MVWMVSVHAVEKKKGRVLEKYTWLIHLTQSLGILTQLSFL